MATPIEGRPPRGGRIVDEQCGTNAGGSEPFDLLGDPCPDCGAWHGIRPLTHLSADEPCKHDRNRPCLICGEPVGDLSIAGPEICGICAAARTKPVEANHSQTKAPDLPTPARAPSEEAPHSGLPPHLGAFSRQIARGLALACVVFALGSVLGYSFAVYGPRWWPTIAEWFASDFTINHRAPMARLGAVTTAKGPAENKNLDGRIREDHLASLMAECDRQIAEHRWDNALKTYQQIDNEFPGSPAAAQLGVRLSAILWSEGSSAARAERLDEAVMLFGMLKLLPPVPAEAILANAKDERPPRSSTPDDTAGCAALIDPPHTGSSGRPEVTSARPSEASDDSREIAAAAGGTSATRLSVPPLPSSAQGATPHEVRLRQEFEQFLNERQQASISPQDRETLFGEFKKLIESKKSQANGSALKDAPESAGSSQRVETWQALETTNLRELGSAASTAIGEVAKGSTFRVIGRSEDGKWLKVKTRDGLTGYYWAARARETR